MLQTSPRRGENLVDVRDSAAERVGFEPTIRLHVFRFSRPACSTAPAPLHYRFPPHRHSGFGFGRRLRGLTCSRKLAYAAMSRGDIVETGLFNRSSTSPKPRILTFAIRLRCVRVLVK